MIKLDPAQRKRALEVEREMIGHEEEHAFELVWLRDLVAEFADATQTLRDFQNGCPLPSYEKGWNDGMNRCRAAIAKAEGGES